MNAPTTQASPVATTDEDFILATLVELISNYVDVQGQEITRSTELARLGVDSLTAAELLFELEDRLDVNLGDPVALPATVGEVLDHALPVLARRSRANRLQ